MSQYVVVANTPNRVATVHLLGCSHLGSPPLRATESAQRNAFDNGLEALLAAQAAMPSNFGLCGHCLKRYKALRFCAAV